MDMRLNVVVTAAGSSRRMGGGNKLLIPLKGRPLLLLSLELFESLPYVDEIAVSAPSGQEEDYRRLFSEAGLKKVTAVVTGGAERQDSIYEALKSIKSGSGKAVAVHDGARPLITAALVNSLMEALSGADGVVPGVPVKDTIKRVDSSGIVVETLKRAELAAVQTPQIFMYDKLMAAYGHAFSAGLSVTDDASIMEYFGGAVRIVEGGYSNIKITTAEDLPLAERLMAEVAHGN